MSNAWLVVASITAFACLALIARSAGMAVNVSDLVGSDDDLEFAGQILPRLKEVSHVASAEP